MWPMVSWGAAALAAAVIPLGTLGLSWANARTGPVKPAPDPHVLLLARSDLGSGWATTTAAPRTVPAIPCSRLHLHLTGGAAHPLAAASPTFGEGSGGPFVAETADVYVETAQASQVWRGVARRALLPCLADGFVRGAARGVKFTVVSERLRPAPRLGVPDASFEIVAVAARGTESVNAYLDVLLLGHDNGVAELSFSSLLSAPASRLELRLARTVAGRMTRRLSAGAPAASRR
jgi:hypothetical protein